jgi:c-di-GMP-binding flagellar brake protein YcgR
MKTEEKETKSHSGPANFEKRRYPRVNLDLNIGYYRTNLPITRSVRLTNASEGGLSVYFPERMKIGERLRLKLVPKSGSAMNAIGPQAEVVWVAPHLDETWLDYQSGVKFIDISPEDLDRLKDFLKSLSP